MTTPTRRDALRLLTAGAAALRLGRAADAPPNIVYMMADDHAAHAISAYGSRINRDTAPEWELFDMAKDPHEMNNLYGDAKHEKVARDLKQELARVRKQYHDEDSV
jgi:hypothetical protein